MLIGRRSLIEGGAFFQVRRVIQMKIQSFVIVSFQATINSSNYDAQIVFYIPDVLVISMASSFVYGLHMHFKLVTVRLWSVFQPVSYFQMRCLFSAVTYFNLSMKQCGAFSRQKFFEVRPLLMETQKSTYIKRFLRVLVAKGRFIYHKKTHDNTTWHNKTVSIKHGTLYIVLLTQYLWRYIFAKET